MLVGLDHLVIRNALVPFADGTYLEIVAFIDPPTSRTTCGAGDRSSKLAVAL
jgi:hypothetical protein